MTSDRQATSGPLDPNASAGGEAGRDCVADRATMEGYPFHRIRRASRFKARIATIIVTRSEPPLRYDYPPERSRTPSWSQVER